jgi:hypothetical protein
LKSPAILKRLIIQLIIIQTFFFFNRRKKEAREVHERAEHAKKLHGLRAKLYNKKRHAEKVQMKKT